jgi:hypothetical protein
MSRNWPSLLAACMLGVGAHAETVDTIRVFEHDYPPPKLAADGCSTPAAPAAAGAARKWYEVTYAYQGRIFREVIGYHPGKTIDLLANGKPQSVPYDNRE